MIRLETRQVDYKTEPEMQSVLQELAIPMEKRDIYLKGSKTPLGRFQAVIRTDTMEELSVVSPGYRLLQHNETLQEMLDALHSNGWCCTRLSLERNGAHAFVQLVNKKFNLMEGTKEVVNPRMVLHNSVDLRSSLKAIFGAFRLICANGMTIPDDRFENLDLRAIHMGEMPRLNSFLEELQGKMESLMELGKTYRGLMNQAVTPQTAEKILATIAGKRQVDRLLTLWDHAPGNKDTEHTKWSLYNAITYWLTHEASGGVYYQDLRNRRALNAILNLGKRSN